MKRMFEVGIFLLIIFYCAIAYIGLNPVVSKDYYDYYISKTSDLSPKELSMKLANPQKEDVVAP
jgi:hypothetical protein